MMATAKHCERSPTQRARLASRIGHPIPGHMSTHGYTHVNDPHATVHSAAPASHVRSSRVGGVGRLQSNNIHAWWPLHPTHAAIHNNAATHGSTCGFATSEAAPSAGPLSVRLLVRVFEGRPSCWNMGNACSWRAWRGVGNDVSVCTLMRSALPGAPTPRRSPSSISTARAWV